MDVRVALRDALSRYGEKCRVVLEAALAVYRRYSLMGQNVPGHFDYRGLVEELQRRGYSYNPSMLLRALEREYGIIETVVHTSTQRWYKFKDVVAVEEVLREGIELDDPEIVALRIQIAALQLPRILRFLRKLASKPRLSGSDLERFRRFAFGQLPLVVKLLKKATKYEDELYTEIEMLNEVLKLANYVAEKALGLEPRAQEVSESITVEALKDLA